MARPWKHPQSGVYYVRERIPRDVLAKARGLKIVLPSDAGGGSLTLRDRSEHAKASLRTRDPREAKERHSAAASHLSRMWGAVRSGPRPLSRKQIVALAGEMYRAFADSFEEDPGSPGAWDHVLRKNGEALRGEYGFAPLLILDDKERREHSMEERYGRFADGMLSAKAIITDAGSRHALIEELGRALSEAAAKLKRNAEGDYHLDKTAERFPAWEPGSPQRTRSGPMSVPALFEGWKREAEATGLAAKTIKEYRSILSRFAAFVAKDAAQVNPHDVVAWKDKRLAEGRSAKTVRDGDLAALMSVFGWGERNQHIPSNPARGVTVRLARRPKTRSKGFTNEEAATILGAALSYRAGSQEDAKTAAAKRWLPWLCAYTAARVGEVAQLRPNDVHQVQGHWVISITPEAGSVKTKEQRDVPIHPHLIEAGFIDFVQGSSGLYLFLNATGKADVAGRRSALKNRVAVFVRGLVPDQRVAPNHGWRHAFRTRATEAGISERIIDAIGGWAPATVGAGYGDVSVKAMPSPVLAVPRRLSVGLGQIGRFPLAAISKVSPKSGQPKK